MAHWEHRPEPAWKRFRFNQPYAKGLARLRENPYRSFHSPEGVGTE